MCHFSLTFLAVILLMLLKKYWLLPSEYTVLWFGVLEQLSPYVLWVKLQQLPARGNSSGSLIYGQTNHIQKENLLLIPNTSPYGLLCILLIVLVDSKERFFIVLNSYEYFSLIPYTVWLPLAREGLCL